jgi:hypothetical protein
MQSLSKWNARHYSGIVEYVETGVLGCPVEQSSAVIFPCGCEVEISAERKTE